MEISTARHESCLILLIHGELSGIGSANSFYDTVTAEIKNHATAEIIIDLSHALLPDSKFISKLIIIHREQSDQGRTVSLRCHHNETVYDILKLFSLTTILPMVD